MLDIRNYIARLMDRATLASAMAEPVVRREEVFSNAFVAGDGI